MALSTDWRIALRAIGSLHGTAAFSNDVWMAVGTLVPMATAQADRLHDHLLETLIDDGFVSLQFLFYFHEFLTTQDQSLSLEMVQDVAKTPVIVALERFRNLDR